MKKTYTKTKWEARNTGNANKQLRQMKKLVCHGHARSKRRHGECVRCGGHGNAWTFS